jgi:antitoxin component YwqK of YwqJK toxin-antitoxin module
MKKVIIVVFLIVPFWGHAQTIINNCFISDSAVCFNNKINGKKEGWWSNMFFSTKKYKSISHYDNGKKDGQCYVFYKTGHLKKIGSYEKGKKQGKWCLYRNNVSVGEGILKCIEYKNGKRGGIINDFFPDL